MLPAERGESINFGPILLRYNRHSAGGALGSQPFSTRAKPSRLHKALQTVSTVALAVTLTASTMEAMQRGPRPISGPGPDDVIINPGQSINNVVSQHPWGTSFFIKAGTYRESVTLPPNTVLRGEFGAVLSGSRIVTPVWQAPYWVVMGVTEEGPISPICENGYFCERPEQLFIGPQRLQQVETLSEVGPGRWFLDYMGDKLYFVDDPGSQIVELSSLDHAIEGDVGATVENLVIRRYAVPGTNDGSAALGGLDQMTVEHCLIEDNAGVGIRTHSSMIVRNNRVIGSGLIGIEAGSFQTNILIENNEVSMNNTKGFDEDWSAGGIKLFGVSHVEVTGNTVVANNGHGIWIDGSSSNVRIEGNYSALNSAGIFYEVSQGGLVRWNTAENNKQGILIANSSEVVVSENILNGNESAIFAKSDCRGDASFLVKNLSVSGNDVSQIGHPGPSSEWPFGKVAGYWVAPGCPEFAHMTMMDLYDGQGNIWQGNYYRYSPNGDQPFYWWDGGSDVDEITFAEWVSLGHDVGSTFMNGFLFSDGFEIGSSIRWSSATP